MTKHDIPSLDALGREFARVASDDVKPRRLRFAAGGACAVAVAIALAALAASGDGGDAEAGDVDPLTRATFAVFDRPRTERDAMPGSPEDMATYEVDQQPGENRAASRRVDLHGEAFYIWPMHGGVCVTWGNCVSTSTVRELGVALSSSVGTRDGQVEDVQLSGIVRDGIHSVRFTMPAGDDVVVDVRDNLFTVELPAVPTGMYWTDDDGRRQADPALPGLVPDGELLEGGR